MDEFFEPITAKHAEATEKQVQAIENNTQAIQLSSTEVNKISQKSIKQGIQEYDEIANRNDQ